MQVVATVTMAVGARLLAQKKAIVARLSPSRNSRDLRFSADKTGTLTQNKLTLYDPVLVDPATTSDDIVFNAALAAKRMEEGQDAIDYCITRAAEQIGKALELDAHEELDFLPFDPVIKRTEATVRRKSDGVVFRVTKGAPQVIIGMCDDGATEAADDWPARKAKALQAVEDLASRGYRALGVAVTVGSGDGEEKKDARWKFLGVLSLFDPPRVDTARTIERACAMGIEVK